MEDELEFVLHNIVGRLAASEGRKQDFRDATRADRALFEVTQFLLLMRNPLGHLWTLKRGIVGIKGTSYMRQKVCCSEETESLYPSQ